LLIENPIKPYLINSPMLPGMKKNRRVPASLLVANPLNRYLINSPMLPQFKLDPDGGLTLIIQNESPGKDKESNWLPRQRGHSSCSCAFTGLKKQRLEATGKRRRLNEHPEGFDGAKPTFQSHGPDDSAKEGQDEHSSVSLGRYGQRAGCQWQAHRRP
jgi:hypothetical protein